MDGEPAGESELGALMGATLSDQLTEAMRAAVVAANFPVDCVLESVVPCGNASHGDFQSNVAFRLGKAAKMSPRDVATRLVAALDAGDLIASADVAGPGFINLRLRDETVARDVVARNCVDLGTPHDGAGKTLVIDYSSPNVAKRMHVGHLRSTVIGNALDRMHRFLGWKVIADNHIGDWGTQFGKLIVAWERWRNEIAFKADAIAELQRLYQKFGVEEKTDASLTDLARSRTAALQAGDEASRVLWRDFVDRSLVEFDSCYRRLGVHFDVMNGESFYEPRLASLVDELLASGVAEVDAGAVLVRFSAEDGPGLGEGPLLIRKSDGAVLYGATDIATFEHRRQTWSPDLILYVVDGRQALHFAQLFATVKRLGWSTRSVHLGFGLLRLPGGDVASTKKGTVVNLVDVLDTAVQRARAVVDERSEGLSEAERAAVAEAVGVGALKYFDLSQNPTSDITFDWDRSLALDGNTAPYLMYAHARCCSLLRRSAAAGLFPGPVLLEHPAERELAILLCRFPDIIRASASNFRPNILCEHLYATTGAFSRFWEHCRVLGTDIPAEIAASRLTVVGCTGNALRAGLSLLGIDAVERM